MTMQDESIRVVTESDVTSNERRVDTPHGRVFVRDIPGEDPPIVLMHGFPDDHRIYDKLLPLLSPRRAVAFDWLGYGRSDRPNAVGFSLDEHGSVLAAVLDELGISRAVLVGHDASGPDAVAFAVAHPQRVAHLVLLNTMFGHQPALHLPEMIRLLADPALTPLADAMINDEGQRLWLLQHTADQWGLDAVDPDSLAIQSILPQFFGDADQPDALTAIRAWTAGLFDALVRQDDAHRQWSTRTPRGPGLDHLWRNGSLSEPDPCGRNSRTVQGPVASSGAKRLTLAAVEPTRNRG